MCQRGFMVALNSSRRLVAGRENTQVQRASPSGSYSRATSTWPVTFQNKSFGWTETKPCVMSLISNFQDAKGEKGPPGEGFLSEPFRLQTSTALRRTEENKSKDSFSRMFSLTQQLNSSQVQTHQPTPELSLRGRDWKILSVSNQVRLPHTRMSPPRRRYSIQIRAP